MIKAKNRVSLSINTADSKEICIRLSCEKGILTIKKKNSRQKPQEVLLLINKLLQKHALSVRDITSIEVNPGPGSYTGLRVGVAIANALSFSLLVPLNNKKIGEFVEPTYT